MKVVVLCGFLLVALAGCGTPYKSVGVAGGHMVSPAPGKLEQVSFSGNGFSNAEKIQKYALYRCAEHAQTKGKMHFVIYESLVDAVLDRPADLPRVGSLGPFPRAVAFILLLDEPRYGSKQTRLVIKDLEPLINVQSPKN